MRMIRTLSVTAALLIGLTACSSAPVESAPADAAAGDVDEGPQRIVALSSDAAIALHELGLTDRIVAVPASAQNASLNPYADDMADIENVIPGDTSPEPEQVLAWSPDLVVVTARHTGEQDAAELLEATDVPVLTLTNGWSTSDAVIENLQLIGEATGAEGAADELVAEIEAGLDDVRAASAEAEETPSVAILSNQAAAPFINASSSLVSELVTNGGGTNVADEIGVAQTMPIQPEQLVAADPDTIMLVDVTGKGESSFDEILANPAVAALPAVQEGRVQMFMGREVYALAGREVVSGSAAVLAWLHPELAE